MHQEREGEVPVETNWQPRSREEIEQVLKQSMPEVTERYNVNYHALKDVACGSAKSRAAMGMLTATLALIFRAAL